jgi:hypothetical protein
MALPSFGVSGLIEPEVMVPPKVGLAEEIQAEMESRYSFGKIPQFRVVFDYFGWKEDLQENIINNSISNQFVFVPAVQIINFRFPPLTAHFLDQFPVLFQPRFPYHVNSSSSHDIEGTVSNTTQYPSYLNFNKTNVTRSVSPICIDHSRVSPVSQNFILGDKTTTPSFSPVVLHNNISPTLFSSFGDYSIPDALTQHKILQFESRFESGNLLRAVLVGVGSYEYDLIIRPDLNTKSHSQWFFFRVSNMCSNTTYRFNIINFQKSLSLYEEGMRPLFYSKNLACEKGVGWHRIGLSFNVNLMYLLIYHTFRRKYLLFSDSHTSSSRIFNWRRFF